MPSKVIPVPKTPKEAYNPQRSASSLLRSQALHLHEALKWHVAEAQAILAINPRTLHTEGAVSSYIQKVTAKLHPHAAKRQ
jgi:hypothetical protein